jgi:hypothetical protein
MRPLTHRSTAQVRRSVLDGRKNRKKKRRFDDAPGAIDEWNSPANSTIGEPFSASWGISASSVRQIKSTPLPDLLVAEA